MSEVGEIVELVGLVLFLAVVFGLLLYNTGFYGGLGLLLCILALLPIAIFGPSMFGGYDVGG